MKLKLIKVNNENKVYIANKIREMESDIYYPLGDDFFKIDHGKNYFSFFERLGDMHYWAAFNGEEMVGVAAGIIRTVENKKAWYLCDLKVVKKYRGKGVPQFIFKRAFLYNVIFHRVYRAYAVSMDSKDNVLPFHKIKRATINLLKADKHLNIYSINKNQVEDFLNKYPDFYLVNTNEKKELILKSSNNKIPLFHLSNNCSDLGVDNILDDDSVIMISAIMNDFIDSYFKSKDIKPDSTATLLSFRLDDIKHVFTDEI